MLRDVQGNALSHKGTRHVDDGGDAGAANANINFQVADISDNALSLGKLLRNGFVFRLYGENDSNCSCKPTQFA